MVKARKHLAIHLTILFVVSLFTFLIIKERIFSLIDLTLIISIGLYFLGAILPDADSNNKGSYIYYKEGLVILAHTVSWLEYPIAKYITKRKIAHRESLHTITGIAITSLFVLLVITIFSYHILHIFSFITIFVWFLSLFMGQLLHLVEDIQPNWPLSLI